MVRNARGAADLPPPGAVALDVMTTAAGAVGARLSDAALLGGGASAAVAAGLCHETEEEIGLSPETGTINLQDPSQGPGAALGPRRESE